MLKDVTIFTSDEMEIIRRDINNMIKYTEEIIFGERDTKIACAWLLNGLKEFKNVFE